MARPKSTKGTEWKGFANVPFNAEARMLYEATELTEAGVHTQLEDLLATGYRVAFSYDKVSDCAQCSITCSNPKSQNDGYTMTSRGPTWWDALSVAVFKHNTLCEQVWPKAEATQGDKWG